jgi:DNA polymerase IIIc chi subunit
MRDLKQKKYVTAMFYTFTSSVLVAYFCELMEISYRNQLRWRIMVPLNLLSFLALEKWDRCRVSYFPYFIVKSGQPNNYIPLLYFAYRFLQSFWLHRYLLGSSKIQKDGRT